MIDLKSFLVGVAVGVLVGGALGFALGLTVSPPAPTEALAQPAEFVVAVYATERALAAMDSIESWVGQMTAQPITFYVQ